MKYALLVYSKPGSFEALGEDERAKVYGQYQAVDEAPDVVGGDQLQAPETATTIRVEDGQTLTTDGPFADTKEILGGFYMLEAEHLDRAIELASQIPATWMGGSVEIRPVVERQR
jgi:hypothetical protein